MSLKLPDPKLIGSLLDRKKWRESFSESISQLIDEKRGEIDEGKEAVVSQCVDKMATSMQITADAIREEHPKAAKAIDKARKRLEKILN